MAKNKKIINKKYAGGIGNKVLNAQIKTTSQKWPRGLKVSKTIVKTQTKKPNKRKTA